MELWAVRHQWFILDFNQPLIHCHFHSFDCTGNEQKATEKRDGVKAEFDGIKKQLSDCTGKVSIKKK